MESIGQLTGGVAHDFNNLLTAVVGNLDLAIARTGEERTRELLQSAQSAAERGAVLTQRLLAFARKQLLQPAAVDISSLVHEISDLLLRALGPSVNLTCTAEPGLWPALVDRNQLELIVLNLAINARDAMPDGGTVTIALANRKAGGAAPSELPPGDYVVVGVSDIGVGMDEATLKRAFEPFFTTKEVGKGTGLGLSMVHGIVAQSGGATRLRSVVGQGTTVEVWLPRAREAPLEQPVRAAAETPAAGGTVLVCDDDPLVCELVVRCLQDGGYAAVVAEGGAAALAVLDAGRPVDALVVDFAMPEMNGAAVARAARERRPGLPALLITGHADQAAIEAEAGGLPILRKPFKQAELLRSVAALLPPGREAALLHAAG
jgi:CheY-like chemotaxis protein/two-component sensor histidine kinase